MLRNRRTDPSAGDRPRTPAQHLGRAPRPAGSPPSGRNRSRIRCPRLPLAASARDGRGDGVGGGHAHRGRVPDAVARPGDDAHAARPARRQAGDRDRDRPRRLAADPDGARRVLVVRAVLGRHPDVGAVRRHGRLHGRGGVVRRRSPRVRPPTRCGARPPRPGRSGSSRRQAGEHAGRGRAVLGPEGGGAGLVGAVVGGVDDQQRPARVAAARLGGARPDRAGAEHRCEVDVGVPLRAHAVSVIRRIRPAYRVGASTSLGICRIRPQPAIVPDDPARSATFAGGSKAIVGAATGAARRSSVTSFYSRSGLKPGAGAPRRRRR